MPSDFDYVDPVKVRANTLGFLSLSPREKESVITNSQIGRFNYVWDGKRLTISRE